MSCFLSVHSCGSTYLSTLSFSTADTKDQRNWFLIRNETDRSRNCEFRSTPYETLSPCWMYRQDQILCLFAGGGHRGGRGFPKCEPASQSKICQMNIQRGHISWGLCNIIVPAHRKIIEETTVGLNFVSWAATREPRFLREFCASFHEYYAAMFTIQHCKQWTHAPVGFPSQPNPLRGHQKASHIPCCNRHSPVSALYKHPEQAAHWGQNTWETNTWTRHSHVAQSSY